MNLDCLIASLVPRLREWLKQAYTELESLITGTITPNQPATLKQCLSKLGGGNSALLTGNQ